MQNQHFVPKFLLKNFADTDGKVFRFDKSSDFVDKLAPKYAASEGDFYEFERDGEVLSFEGRFQNIETKAAPRLRRIIEANSLASTSAEDRSHIATFMAAQAFRTQAFLSNLKERPTREKLGSVLENLWESSFITAEMITQRHLNSP